MAAQTVNSLPSQVSAMVRENVRRDLAQLFESFTKTATEEEVRFLHEVMVTWQAISTRTGPEVEIASAFELCIGGRGYYLCVESPDLKEAVVRFMRETPASGSAFRPRGNGWYLWKSGPSATA